jgi:hypothetical protein
MQVVRAPVSRVISKLRLELVLADRSLADRTHFARTVTSPRLARKMSRQSPRVDCVTNLALSTLVWHLACESSGIDPLIPYYVNAPLSDWSSEKESARFIG